MIELLKKEFINWKTQLMEASPKILVGLVLLLLLIGIGSLVKGIFLKRFSKRFSDQLLAKFLGNLLFWIFTLIGVALLLGQLGLGKAVTGLLAGAGLTAVILGFAFKDIGENILAGIMLAFSRPFDIGDVVEVSGFTGTVESLNLRNTQLRTFDGRDIFIPNADLIKHILVNYTRDGLLRHSFIVGIDYGESINNVVELINQTLKEVDEIVHEEDLAPFTAIDDFASSTINLRVHFWINSFDFVGSTVELKSKVMQRVIESLNQAHVAMPSDIQEHKLYDSEQVINVRMKSNEEQ